MTQNTSTAVMQRRVEPHTSLDDFPTPITGGTPEDKQAGDLVARCRICDGRGYTRCDCWPGDCICGSGNETCEYCEVHGTVLPEDCEDGHYHD